MCFSMSTPYKFTDGFVTIEGVDKEFFKQAKSIIVKKILEAFSENRNYQYPIKRCATYDGSANIHTQCRCNFYRLRCKFEDINCVTNTLEVEVCKKEDSDCACEIRLHQLKGEARGAVKKQLRVQEVFELDSNDGTSANISFFLKTIHEKVRILILTNVSLMYFQ